MTWILSAAVSVPLLWRGFYYLHIDRLHLTEITPWTYDEIKTAYDQMMDFCMKGAPFGTGVLKWSEDGMNHFADCRILFMLDINLLKLSSAALIVLFTLSRVKKYSLYRVFGRGPFFWAGALWAAAFAVISLLVVFVDFDHAFVTFHQLFFPGKSNWIFYEDVDEIINVLPEVFFMDCAILIVAVLMGLCLLSIVIDFLSSKKKV